MSDTPAPLIITPEVREELHKLRDRADRNPVHMPEVARLLKTPRGKRLHMAFMTAQTIVIRGPWDFYVTFCRETGHPIGLCRHMSMSIMREGRLPHPDGVLMVAKELGFVGGLPACRVWIEDLGDGGKAVNLVQPIIEGAGHD